MRDFLRGFLGLGNFICSFPGHYLFAWILGFVWAAVMIINATLQPRTGANPVDNAAPAWPVSDCRPVTGDVSTDRCSPHQKPPA